MIDETGDVAAKAVRFPFYFVGPTAAGKSEIAAEVARICGAEIVSADAFQIYRGLDLLSAKPGAAELAAAPHHLIGAVSLAEEMNAEKYRQRALAAMAEIDARGKQAFVVGGTGMYLRALSDGLSPLPSADPKLRSRLEQLSANELLVRLRRLDPATARTIDPRNPRRLIRAVEICLLSGKPASAQRQRKPAANARGVFVFRDREELRQRIDARVEKMFACGVVEEVRAVKTIGPTARQMLGFSQIRELIDGKISERDCIGAIQQATRRYAKRQLTWFRRQTNFAPLNLSRHGFSEAIELIVRQARLSPTDV